MFVSLHIANPAFYCCCHRKAKQNITCPIGDWTSLPPQLIEPPYLTLKCISTQDTLKSHSYMKRDLLSVYICCRLRARLHQAELTVKGFRVRSGPCPSARGFLFSWTLFLQLFVQDDASVKEEKTLLFWQTCRGSWGSESVCFWPIGRQFALQAEWSEVVSSLMSPHLIRTMEPSRLACLCLLSWATLTAAAGNGKKTHNFIDFGGIRRENVSSRGSGNRTWSGLLYTCKSHISVSCACSYSDHSYWSRISIWGALTPGDGV